MTAPTESLAPPPAGLSRATLWAIGGVGLCAVIWGTTWFAITLQLGQVAPLASIVWRFGLAAVVLFAGCLLTRRSLKLTLNQHLAAAGQGVFAFSLSYSFTYAAEGRIASAIVAVIFASLALLNLILFRVAARQRAAAEQFAQLVHRQSAVHEQRAVVALHHRRRRRGRVAAGRAAADHRAQQVVDGHDTGDVAVLVDHQRQ